MLRISYIQFYPQPRIGKEYCEPESQWECPKCAGHSAMEKEERKKSRENSPRKQRPRPQQNRQSEENNKLVLPYDVSIVVNVCLWYLCCRDRNYCWHWQQMAIILVLIRLVTVPLEIPELHVFVVVPYNLLGLCLCWFISCKEGHFLLITLLW